MHHRDVPDNPLGRLVSSSAFQNAILGLILIAAVLVGVETYAGIVAEHGQVLHLLDRVIIWLFALEAAQVRCRLVLPAHEPVASRQAAGGCDGASGCCTRIPSGVRVSKLWI